jgi:ferritin
MISDSMAQSLNSHLNTEHFSAQLYLSMSSVSGTMGLKGAANWFMVQYQEEMVHFMKFYTYLSSQGVVVKLVTADIPNEYSSLLEMFEKTLAHEQHITKAINRLMDQAGKESDHATQIFLQWFVTEQIEEEENDRDIIGKLKLIGDNGYGLLMLDSDLSARVFVPPPTAAA